MIRMWNKQSIGKKEEWVGVKAEDGIDNLSMCVRCRTAQRSAMQ